MGGALPYSELDVTALLDSYGERLYLYFWLMLGDEVLATRALTDTIISVVPDPAHRELFTVARRVCRQYQPAPAALHAEAKVATLAAVTIVALRRLDPDDREICMLGAPRYGLDDTDLAAILGTWAVDVLRPRAAAAFGSELAACTEEAGLEQGGNLAWQALRQLGSDAIAVPYDQIVPLATDAVLEGLREGIRTRVAVPTQASPPPDRPLDVLESGPEAIFTFAGIPEAEHRTVPLPRVPGTESGRPGRWGWRALAGVALAAAIPAAIAGVAASSGHSAHTGHSVHGGLQPVPQAAPPSGVSRSTAPSAASSPAQVHGTGRGAAGGQSAPAATMPAGAPMATAPSRMMAPVPTYSRPARVTAPPTVPTMSPTPTVPTAGPPTTPASPTPSPSATTKLATITHVPSPSEIGRSWTASACLRGTGSRLRQRDTPWLKTAPPRQTPCSGRLAIMYVSFIPS
jgi:hypothetical protein